MSSDAYDEFAAIVGYIERHTGDGSCPHAVAAKLVPCLRILGRGEADPAWRELRHHLTGAAPTWPEIREECRQSIKAAAAWAGGKPEHVAAAVDNIAAMDPRHRHERRAVLTSAWSDLLAT